MRLLEADKEQASSNYFLHCELITTTKEGKEEKQLLLFKKFFSTHALYILYTKLLCTYCYCPKVIQLLKFCCLTQYVPTTLPTPLWMGKTRNNGMAMHFTVHKRYFSFKRARKDQTRSLQKLYHPKVCLGARDKNRLYPGQALQVQMQGASDPRFACGAWQATARGVAKSRTQLSDFTSLHTPTRVPFTTQN